MNLVLFYTVKIKIRLSPFFIGKCYFSGL